MAGQRAVLLESVKSMFADQAEEVFSPFATNPQSCLLPILLVQAHGIL